MLKKTVIITAGGIGSRMNNALPKQFLEIQGKTILEQTILCFYNYSKEIEIIITLPEDWIFFWEELCKKNNFLVKHQLVSGGVERFHSIQNALKIATGELIAIHDGVRPLVSNQTIEKAFDLCKLNGNAIPIFPLKESIRFLDEKESKALNRKLYFTVQTPQVFKKEILTNAYQQEFHDKITDDASLVEETGVKIHTFIGNEENIKITTPIDLKFAEIVLEN